MARKKSPPRRRRRLIMLAALAAGALGLWVAIHRVAWLGPWLADTGRAVLGPRAVAWAEDFAYDVQDRIDRWRYANAPPRTFWDAPSGAPPEAEAPPPPAEPTDGGPQADAEPTGDGFPPAAYAPPVPSVAARGDGVWIPLKDGGPAGEPPAMWKSLVHPDARRGFAAVAVVAIDLRRIDLHLVAGTSEPFSITVPSSHRPGIVPKDQLGALVAAFNGGFKAIHGHYGMMLNGATFLAPRDIACTIGLYKDGTIRIRTWPNLKPSEPDMVGYRQTPPCLVEEGAQNSALDEYTKNWGTTVSGDTVIRRSAIGIDKAGTTLFYGLGEAVTAQALARGMKASGSYSAAQLDVNYAYPRFLIYERATPEATPRATSTLIPGITFTHGEYVSESAGRDFFYLTRKVPHS